MSYAKYIGRAWVPPVGCFTLVADIYRDRFGIETDIQPAGDTAGHYLATMTRRVEHPQEGDLVLIATSPWHIGMMINSHEFIHCMQTVPAMISDINNPEWGNRVRSFHRPLS